MIRTPRRRDRVSLGTLLGFAAFYLACAGPVPATAGPDFLVVAPDRGFLGNQEIRAVFEEFKAAYAAASLLFIGRDYTGVGSPYSEYVSRALAELSQAGVTDLVAIPFFVSNADPILQRVRASLADYRHTGTITWAPPMADSYLIGQVMLDRAVEFSGEPAHEQFIVVGFGATDAANERSMHRHLGKLADYVSRYRRPRETRSIVYYDRAAPNAEERNEAADAVLTRMAAQKGRTLVLIIRWRSCLH
jgi:hypothetical protein